MKPYDILAIGELNVDLILNNIDGEPEVGEREICRGYDSYVGKLDCYFCLPMPPRWVQKWALWE